jgi:hypothetical protein
MKRRMYTVCSEQYFVEGNMVLARVKDKKKKSCSEPGQALIQTFAAN